MDRMQKQNRRIKQWVDAKSALYEFCRDVKRVTVISALYFLKGYTNGEMRIDDALMLINALSREGVVFIGR